MNETGLKKIERKNDDFVFFFSSYSIDRSAARCMSSRHLLTIALHSSMLSTLYYTASSRVKLDLPYLDPCIHPRPRQPAAAALVAAAGQPEDGVDTPSDCVLDRYVLDRLLDAPDVYVRVERTAGTM